ncbi:MAG: hypothetical protein Tsb002_26860 [Wenzhouxiangellaceae bacterium]
MNMYKYVTTVVKAGMLVSVLAAGTAMANGNSQFRFLEGKVATGPNRFADQPLRDYGVFLGIPAGTLGFREVGVYNPDGSEPFPLTVETDDSAILSSFVDPNFLAFLGLTMDDIDPDFINVPLQNVKTVVDGDGVTRGQLPGIFDSVPMEKSIAAPNGPITWGDWKKARGFGAVRCENDGSAFINLRFRHMIPNRLYTVWGGIFHGDQGLIEEPLGGAPSAFVTDMRGNAKFERVLNFCPMEFNAEANAQLGFLMILLHTDHMAYGGVFAPESAGLIGGTVSNIHMEFHFIGEDVSPQ